jgi:Carboxypeptidase regulatory-like domain
MPSASCASLPDSPSPRSLAPCSDAKAKFPGISVKRTDISEVRVVLGSKGGVLSGDLRDDATERAIPGAKVTIRDAWRHEVFVEVFVNEVGHFQFTVPNRPIRILATAPGYEATRYGKGAELTLSQGERRSVTLDLTHN